MSLLAIVSPNINHFLTPNYPAVLLKGNSAYAFCNDNGWRSYNCTRTEYSVVSK